MKPQDKNIMTLQDRIVSLSKQDIKFDCEYYRNCVILKFENQPAEWYKENGTFIY